MKMNTKNKEAKKSVLVSILVNVILGFVQIIGGMLSHSHALIADGLHSIADLISDFIALFAAYYSHKPADLDHTYGHRRYENAASLILGLILIFTGLGMIYYAGHKLQHLSDAKPIHFVAIVVSAIVVVVKELLFRYMLNAAKKTGSTMLIANAWHARSDAASSLVASLAIIGSFLGFKYLDPLAAIIVGTVIAGMGSKFAWQALQYLLDVSAEDEYLEKIKLTVLAQEGVKGFHRLRTRKAGSDIFLDIHIEVDGNLNLRDAHQISCNVHAALMSVDNIVDAVIHIDPVD